jgi:DNA-binding Lrp family transcriptional regulator
MTPEEIVAMVADYRAGVGSWRLARKYGVSDSTVLARLKAAGVQLDPERQHEVRRVRTEEMRRLKEEGLTLTEIGKRYGITRQAVSLRLSRLAAASSGGLSQSQ